MGVKKKFFTQQDVRKANSDPKLLEKLKESPEIFQDSVQKLIEPLIPKRNRLTYWWQQPPDWFKNAQMADEKRFALQKAQTWKEKI